MAGEAHPFIFGGVRYVVSGRHASVSRSSGRRQMLNEGDVVPPDVKPAQIDHLLRVGLIKKVEAGS